MEDNTFTLAFYAKRLMMHPRTFLRRLLNQPNPSTGFVEQTLIHVEDVADKLNCDLGILKRIMTYKDEAWTAEQACKAFSITKPTLRRYRYPKFLSGHKLTRYSREQLMARHMKKIEL